MERIKLVVNVTADDIKNGIRGNCGKCPVSLAFTRALHEAVPGLLGTVTALVESWQIILWEGVREARGLVFGQGKHHTVSYDGRGGNPMPRGVPSFVHDFDGSYEVKPFSFTIEFDLPEWAVRKVA